MKHYTAKQINEIKQEIRTGKPVVLIADDLAKQWGRPVRGIYSKVLNLSKQTRKINNTYDGPTKRERVKKIKPTPVQKVMEFDPMPNSLMYSIEEVIEDNEAAQVIQEICEEIIDKPVERESAEIGIEVPVGAIAFTGTPNKIIVYSDHIRYYFDN